MTNNSETPRRNNKLSTDSTDRKRQIGDSERPIPRYGMATLQRVSYHDLPTGRSMAHATFELDDAGPEIEIVINPCALRNWGRVRDAISRQGIIVFRRDRSLPSWPQELSEAHHQMRLRLLADQLPAALSAQEQGAA